MLNLYLTGFMGSGKSTIGSALAKKLSKEYVDLDDTIESLTNQSISEIFSTEGENYFRSLEKEIIEGFTPGQNHVVSLGGGSLMDAENLDIIKTSGLLIYLHTSQEILWQRINQTNKRPLLQAKKEEQLTDELAIERISSLYKLREESYYKADIIVDTDSKSVGEVVDSIIDKIG